MLAFTSLITASRRSHFVRVTPDVCWGLAICGGDSFHARKRATPKNLVAGYDAKRQRSLLQKTLSGMRALTTG